MACVCMLLLAGLLLSSYTEPAHAKTLIAKKQTLLLSAVDATILDGTTAGRTYQPADRVGAYTVILAEQCDAVEIHLWSDGAATANDTAKINVYGYGADGPAMRIYEATTVTLGTAVSGVGGLYVDTISGTDKHVTTVAVSDSADNTVAKLTFDTIGYKYLYFEPETFTGITSCVVEVRQYGFN